jgi:hypothetical protein
VVKRIGVAMLAGSGQEDEALEIRACSVMPTKHEMVPEEDGAAGQRRLAKSVPWFGQSALSTVRVAVTAANSSNSLR